jgi:bile acid:Na+ symporter, BASS family
MDPKYIVMLAFQVSIFATVFGFGLKTTLGDLTGLLRRPALLFRSVVAALVVMPVVAFLLVRLFNFLPSVEVALIALSISPVPPILPQRESKAGGDWSYALGLIAVLSLVPIVAVPLELELLQRLTGFQLSMAPETIARIVLFSTLVPLAAGMAVRAFFPHAAPALDKRVEIVAKILLSAAVLVLIVAAAPVMWALVGNGGTLIAMLIFLTAGLAIGHELGGPDPDHAVVLALSTACRHPAIALAIATANFPDQPAAPAILLYVLVAAIAVTPYLAWQRRQMRPAPRPV